MKNTILFALALGADLATVKEFSPLRYDQLYQLFPDYKPSSIRSCMVNLQKERAVMSYRHGEKTFFRLTTVGREHLLRLLPVFQQQRKKWDQSWRVIVFSGEKPDPGAYRSLRMFLLEQGFAQLERGVYISPFPLSELVKEFLFSQGLLEKITAFETRRFLFGDEKLFCHQWWNLGYLSRQYAKIGRELDNMLKNFHAKKRLSGREKQQFPGLFFRYFLHLQKDPGLPTQLLSLHSREEESYSRLQELFLLILGNVNQ